MENVRVDGTLLGPLTIVTLVFTIVIVIVIVVIIVVYFTSVDIVGLWGGAHTTKQDDHARLSTNVIVVVVATVTGVVTVELSSSGDR